MKKMNYLLLFLLYLLINGCKTQKDKTSINQQLSNVQNNCLAKYIGLSQEIYQTAKNYKSILQNNCNNYIRVGDFTTPLSQSNIVEEILSKTVSYENPSSIQFYLKGTDNIVCGAVSKNIIEPTTISCFHKEETRDLVILFGFYNISYSNNIKGTRLVVGVLPKASYFLTNNDLCSLINCIEGCDFSFSMYFDELPFCLCDWNKEYWKHPITRSGQLLKGDVEYMNDCLFNSDFYKTKM